MLIVQYMVFYLCHKSAGNNTPYLHSVIQDNKNFVIVIFSGVLKEAHNNSLCLQLHRHESDIKAEVLSFPLRRQAALCFSPPLSTMTAHLGPGRLFLHHIAAFVCSWLQYYPPPPSPSLKTSLPLIWLRGSKWGWAQHCWKHCVTRRGFPLCMSLNNIKSVAKTWDLLRGANWIQWPG